MKTEDFQQHVQEKSLRSRALPQEKATRYKKSMIPVIRMGIIMNQLTLPQME